MHQRTVTEAISLTGVGLHSGKNITLTMCPSSVNTGINFLRTDIEDAPLMAADAYLVKDTMMSSNLEMNGIRVGTVEHLMSALAALGIDNLLVKITGAEIPIMDGSAYPYIEHILKAGIKEQNALKRFLRIKKPVKVTQDDKWAELVPYDGYKLTFNIDFNHPAIPRNTQQYDFEFSSKRFIEEVGKARTFGFMKDIEYLQNNNLALGGSLDNAIVLDEFQILNETDLRYPDEFVRHKILDAIGDLYLSKHSIYGHFKAYKSGHALNNRLIKAVIENEDNYEIVTIYDKDFSPIDYSLENQALFS